MDNAGNMNSAIQILAQLIDDQWTAEERRLRCLGHIINLVAHQLIEKSGGISFSDEDDDDSEENDDDPTEPRTERRPLAKLSFLVHYIRRSPNRRAEYRARAEDLHECDNMLVSDTKTRFNSTFMML